MMNKYDINEDFYFVVNRRNPKPCLSIYNHGDEKIWEWSNLRDYKNYNKWIALMKNNTKIFLDEMPKKWYAAASRSKSEYDILNKQFRKNPKLVHIEE
jgi:hypothetical protein